MKTTPTTTPITIAAILAALLLGCQGTLVQPDDDAADDDAADDDAGDDDAGDDDAADDDAGDDDAADDDAADDDAGDDDSGEECPLSCNYYDGWTAVQVTMPDGQAMQIECPTWADVAACQITGVVECDTPDGAGWQLLGAGEPGGDLSGEILANGPQGPVSWPWSGHTMGKDIHGTLQSTTPQGGVIEGALELLCEDWDSGDDDPEDDPGSGE